MVVLRHVLFDFLCCSAAVLEHGGLYTFAKGFLACILAHILTTSTALFVQCECCVCLLDELHALHELPLHLSLL